MTTYTTIKYLLVSCKGSKMVKGTLATVRAIAREMDEQLQPMYGVDIWSVDADGQPVENLETVDSALEE